MPRALFFVGVVSFAIWFATVGLGKIGNGYEHHRPSNIPYWNHPLLLAIHWFGEQTECFFDLGFFLGGDVVFFG